MKILIVDDSRAMQTIVRRGIEQLGYHQLELKKANNGVEALEIVRVWEPDLVISDWHMPEMNGMELLTALNREMLDIKIGFVTTERSAKRLQTAIDAGAQFIVQKPFDSKTLHEAVLPIIQGSVDGEKTLKQHQEKSADSKSDHIQLPNIAILTNSLNALSTVSLCIEKTDPIELEQEHFPYLLGLYGDKKKQSVHAIAIANLEGACILGTLLGRVTEEEMHMTLAEKAIPKSIMDNCQSVLRTLETTLQNTEKKEHLTLRSTNVMRKKNSNVDKLLAENTNNRLDITIKIDRFSCGRLTLIVS
jgi:CheY-like chemotaxis protein